MNTKRVARNFSPVLFFVACGLSFFCSPGGKERKESAATARAAAVARAYGASSFDKIGKMKFTFHVLNKGREIQREWTWDRTTGETTLKFTRDGKTTEHKFNHAQVYKSGDAGLQKLDHMFINDSYWLLFPIRLSQDKTVRLRLENNAKLPISGGQAGKLTVIYTAGDGYTPGDAYDLYFGPDNMIREWVYRKGGGPAPSRVTTWENTRVFGPLKLSLDRNGADKKFRVWFTGVAVQLRGSSDWLR